MPNYAPRVTLSFSDVSGVIRTWADSCKQVVVYEHEADDEVNSTHVHMILMDCEYKTPKSLKDQFYKMIETTRKGNELWSWEHKDFPNPDLSFITYMSKGELEPIFVKDVEQRQIENFKKQWISKRNKKRDLTNLINVEYVPVQVPEHLKKPTQKTKWELLGEMRAEVELWKDQHPNWMLTKTHRNKIVVKVLKDHKQVFGLYKAIDFSYALQMYEDEDSYVDSMDNAMKH